MLSALVTGSIISTINDKSIRGCKPHIVRKAGPAGKKKYGAGDETHYNNTTRHLNRGAALVYAG